MKSHTTTRSRRPIAEIEFCAWVGQAQPGERLVYHRGFLVLDTFALFSGLSDKDRAELRKLADRTFWAAEAGLVHLVQERIGTDQFAYIAIARPRPKSHAPQPRCQPCCWMRPPDDHFPIPFCQSWRQMHALSRKRPTHR